MDMQDDRIVPLDELDDFEVAEGDPDVRGWEVLAADGRRIGEVDELLVDTLAMKVRYLDVDLDDELDDAAGDRHILIPIGYARLDEDDDRIFVDTLNAGMIGGIPAYTHEPLTRDYETRLRTHYDTGFAGTPDAGSDFYEADLYDQNRFYGRRRDTGGEVDDRTLLERTEDHYVGPVGGAAPGALSDEELRLRREERMAGDAGIGRDRLDPRTGGTSATGRDSGFGEFGRGTRGDGVTPEDDLDELRGV